MKIKELFENHINLKSKNILLKQISLEDKASLSEMFKQPEVHKYLPDPACKSDDEVEKVIKGIINKMKRKKMYFWSIFENENLDKAVGVINICYFEIRNKSLKIGYYLNKDYWKRGIATEAIKIVTDFLLNSFKVNRVMAEINSQNIGSSKAVQKNGYKYEGTLRAAWGGKYDKSIYAKIRKSSHR